jgi:hypothetical protein
MNRSRVAPDHVPGGTERPWPGATDPIRPDGAPEQVQAHDDDNSARRGDEDIEDEDPHAV